MFVHKPSSYDWPSLLTREQVLREVSAHLKILNEIVEELGELHEVVPKLSPIGQQLFASKDSSDSWLFSKHLDLIKLFPAVAPIREDTLKQSVKRCAMRRLLQVA